MTRYTTNVVPASDTDTTTTSGDKGVLQFVSAHNVGNGSGTGYSRCEYDFTDLVEGAESYTVSYKAYFNPSTIKKPAATAINMIDMNINTKDVPVTEELNETAPTSEDTAEIVMITNPTI